MKNLQVCGVIHLQPLPGTPRGRNSLETVLAAALADAHALKEGGVTLAILENFGDAPFVRGRVEAHIVSMMTLIAQAIIDETGLDLGINVLRNDALSAMAIAHTVGASFIRVNVHTGAAWTDQGLIQGEAYQTLQYRAQLNSSVGIAADVMVKHATPAGQRSLLDAAKDTVYRGLAERLIVTGTATGASVDWEEVAELKRAIPNTDIWIGSGMTLENVEHAIQYADGVIVGTYFHKDADINKPLDVERIRRFIQAVQ
jgi:membrane complex biogenesis BtpA family protein